MTKHADDETALPEKNRGNSAQPRGASPEAPKAPAEVRIPAVEFATAIPPDVADRVRRTPSGSARLEREGSAIRSLIERNRVAAQDAGYLPAPELPSKIWPKIEQAIQSDPSQKKSEVPPALVEQLMRPGPVDSGHHGFAAEVADPALGKSVLMPAGRKALATAADVLDLLKKNSDIPPAHRQIFLDPDFSQGERIDAPWVGGNRDIDPSNPEDVAAWQERDRQAAEILQPAVDLSPVMFEVPEQWPWDRIGASPINEMLKKIAEGVPPRDGAPPVNPVVQALAQRMYCTNRLIERRLSRYAPEPVDPAVEAIHRMLVPVGLPLFEASSEEPRQRITRAYAKEIVAAVDKARGRKC